MRSALFQLRQSGAPGFLRPFMTDDGRYANISLIYRDHRGETIRQVVTAATHYIERNPIGEVIVRLDPKRGEPEAPWYERQRLLDTGYYMLGPLLPTREHTLSVLLRQPDGRYRPLEVQRVNGSGELPGWLPEFRAGAIADYAEERDAIEEGDFFPWPDSLADWTADDVNWWWESSEHGIRAVGVNTKDLIVHDVKAVEGKPSYQPTNSWTRGMQFVMAGGYMGILAAVNDEVERSHVANIVLILFVIFVLHSVTYQPVPSGFIILLQISTATMLSLAGMAIRNVVSTSTRCRFSRSGSGSGWTTRSTSSTASARSAPTPATSTRRCGARCAPPGWPSFRPRVATALLSEEQKAALALQKQIERRKGLRDD